MSRGPGFIGSAFDAYLSFAHLPLEAEVEQVVLQFACGPSATGGFWTDDGKPLFPNQPERYALRFEVMRGGGQTLARLDPVLLPADSGTPEYEHAVRRFLAASIKLAGESIPMIVQVLAETKN